jgi:hypothetical protein
MGNRQDIGDCLAAILTTAGTHNRGFPKLQLSANFHLQTKIVHQSPTAE